MSRSIKGSKGPGFEYNTRRPGNKHGGIAGKFSKAITHRRERKIGAGMYDAESPKKLGLTCHPSVCSHCHGMGIFIGENQCDVCQGTGKITVVIDPSEPYDLSLGRWIAKKNSLINA